MGHADIYFLTNEACKGFKGFNHWEICIEFENKYFCSWRLTFMKLCAEKPFCWAAAQKKVPEALVYIWRVFSAMVREENGGSHLNWHEQYDLHQFEADVEGFLWGKLWGTSQQ